MMESDKQKFREMEAEANQARERLRDEFGMAALHGMLAGTSVNPTVNDKKKYARLAYEWADAMLEAREG
jgi:hypothetical protein